MTLDAALLDEERALGVNLSRPAGEGIRAQVPPDRKGVATLERLTVPFIFAEREYRVMLCLLGTAWMSNSGTKVGNLSSQRDQITRAMDLHYSGI